jgi:hypothetical protein
MKGRLLVSVKNRRSSHTVRANDERTNSEVPTSYSYSNSGSGSDLGGGAGGPPPEWARKVADTVAMGVGRPAGPGPCGSRTPASVASMTPPRTPTPGDFQAYLSSWANREKREPKSRHNAPRQELGSAASAPWMNGANAFKFEESK